MIFHFKFIWNLLHLISSLILKRRRIKKNVMFKIFPFQIYKIILLIKCHPLYLQRVLITELRKRQKKNFIVIRLRSPISWDRWNRSPTGSEFRFRSLSFDTESPLTFWRRRFSAMKAVSLIDSKKNILQDEIISKIYEDFWAYSMPFQVIESFNLG